MGVPERAFTDVLPLLRRTFGAYEAGVKRTLGELVRRGPAASAGAARTTGTAPEGFAPDLDPVRADAVTELVRMLLASPDGVAAA